MSFTTAIFRGLVSPWKALKGDVVTVAVSIDHLEGRKFCVVFVKVVDIARERVQLQCFRGRANVERGKLNVVDTEGAVFTVPSSAIPTVMPSDGTAILKDAEYYCLVKVDDDIELASLN